MAQWTHGDTVKVITIGAVEGLAGWIATALISSALQDETAKAWLLGLIWLSLIASAFFILVGVPWNKDRQPLVTPLASTTKQPQISDVEQQKPRVEQDTPDDPSALKEQLVIERMNARWWEYQYLNYFLVYKTQLSLDWLASHGKPVLFSVFNSACLPIIQNNEERQRIIDVLVAHYLVEVIGDKLAITGKGMEYVEWRKPMPRLPPLGPVGAPKYESDESR